MGLRPLGQDIRSRFRAIIGPELAWGSIALHHLLKDPLHARPWQGGVKLNQECLTVEVIDQVEVAKGASAL